MREEPVDPVKALSREPPGRAVWAVGRLAGLGSTEEFAFLLREETERIAALGPSPDIEYRGALLHAEGVPVIVLMLRVGPEAKENIWETWLNHAAEPKALGLLTAQPRLAAVFVGDHGKVERALQVPNRLAGFAAKALAECNGRTWTPGEFDVARDEICRAYPGVLALWRRIRGQAEESMGG